MLSTTLGKTHLLISLIALSTTARAESPPAESVYVGAISIEPCQEAKILAGWYSGLGIQTKEIEGGYYAKLDTPAGPLFFAIHRKKADAPMKSSASVSIVFHVEDFEAKLASLKSRGFSPDSTESDPSEGKFAHFHDPDGNKVTIWGK